MSNFGLGLLFALGEAPEPRMLALVDLESVCSSCGAESLRRWYPTVRWHAMTVRRLEALVDEAPALLEEVCGRCEAPLGPDEASGWVVHWGFPGGRGLIQGFGRRDGARRWRLLPHQAMDVQVVLAHPSHDAPGALEVDRVDERTIVQAFGHVLSAKEWIRRALRALLSPDASIATVASELVNAGLPAASAEGNALVMTMGGGLFVRLDRDARDGSPPWLDGDDSFVVETIVSNGMFGPSLPGGADAWLADLQPRLTRWTLRVAARIGNEGEEIRHWAARTVATWPIQVAFAPDGAGVLRMSTVALPAERMPRLEARTIGRHAARTASLPAATTHYAIEEAVHFLAGLFGEEFSDAAFPVTDAASDEAPSSADEADPSSTPSPSEPRDAS